MSVEWCEETFPMGTGGGAAFAAIASNLNPKAWLIMNGDSYLAGDWPERIGKTHEMQMEIVACSMEDTGRYGRVESKVGHLASFAEKKETGPGLINAGIYLIPDQWVREISARESSSLERDWIPCWLNHSRKVGVVEVKGGFLDMGTPDSLAEAGNFIREHVSKGHE
jgi:D-glycero-alpha-D-manno-heptose 1-phosphate guanylyltransferase